MKISKTVFNMAEKRGLDLVVEDDTLYVYRDFEDMEWLISYRITEQGLFFNGHVTIKVEDVPYWIQDEHQLKAFIISYAAEVAA